MQNKDTKDRLLEEIALLRSECEKAKNEARKAKEELAAESWGLQKTNESIKLLYKELERNNEELRGLDRLKSEFVSTVSHELRTPLSMIKAAVDLLLDGIPGKINEKQEKIIIAAKENIDRLARIISNLLDMSKLEAGKVELNRRLIDINRFIKKIASNYEPLMKEKGLEIRMDLPKKETNIYIDGDKMTEVFTNFINNAIKFTEKGYVEIGAKEEGDAILCWVSDSGMGIAISDIPKVFGKFQQFGRKNGAGIKGTGLGLSISKGIIELHGGNVRVESKLNHGTQFIMELPRYSKEMVFRDRLKVAIHKAEEKGEKVSIVVVAISDFDEMKKKLPDDRAHAIIDELEVTIKENLRKPGDTIVTDSDEFIVILDSCCDEGAARVADRFRPLLYEYIHRMDLDTVLHLIFGYATYPNDARNEQELLSVARKRK